MKVCYTLIFYLSSFCFLVGWKCIKQELEYSHKQTNGDNRNNSTKLVQSKIQYINGCTNGSIPKNFVPFDLDSFWGQRLYQNLLQSS